MPEQVKPPRAYRSPLRAAQAQQTRDAILATARELFATQGYAGTAVTDIAGRAGVSVDTVYASVGRKPELMRAVIDTVLGSSDAPLPAEERAYVQDLRVAATAREKLTIYAGALSRLLPVVAPMQEALRVAGLSDASCAEAWKSLVERRAANMRRLATNLRDTGEVRDDLSDDDVADIVWATNSPEYFLLLMQRGWNAEQYRAHLVDLWTRLLLR